ncbi:CRISPR system precrRNA processing endoribonuclease RAMP protein Cas6 [Thalassospira povalilytica]|uniref:CRISPR system precrRNA processing endoribonuclease RAMP protein Cas6 n=1 Tax=Thalassospira povalilytica TaxID=732237 RepID=UPI003AA7DD05
MQDAFQEETSVVRGYVQGAQENRCVIEDIAAVWRMARIVLRCPNAAGLVQDPNTTAKIRGAWGRKLAEGASEEALAKRPCPWPAPCAYDLFFNTHGTLGGRMEIPKPFVLALDADGDDLVVGMTLFGIAADWAGEAADALVRALRHGLDQAGNKRHHLVVSHRDVEQSNGVPVPADMPGGARLVFISPVALRSGEELHVRPASLIKSLGNRVDGFARWHGMALDLDPHDFSRAAEDVGAYAQWEIQRVPVWRRGSVAQNRQIGMAGVLGTLTLPPLPAFIAILVALGACTHAGSRAALGMGRYRLLLPGI